MTVEELLAFEPDATMVFAPVEEATVFQVFDAVPAEAVSVEDDEAPAPEGMPSSPVLEAKIGASMPIVESMSVSASAQRGDSGMDSAMVAYLDELLDEPAVVQAYNVSSDVGNLGQYVDPEVKKALKKKMTKAPRPRASEYMKSSASSVPTCPRCSSKMVMRTNSYNGSKFYGCSRYPKCRGTRNV